MKLSETAFEKLGSLQESWRTNKILTIENFLVLEDADKIAGFLEGLPDNRWAVSVHPFHPTIYTFDNSSENRDTIEAAVKSATAEHERGGFSYYFRRSEPAANDEFDFQRFIMSEECLSLFEQLTGHVLQSSISVFCSCYHARCFLSTHTDIGRGKIAFVYNATRDWDPNEGGCFELLSNDWRRVVRSVPPVYNSLTFFEVENAGVPHRVTTVSAETEKRRLAISGWLV